MTLDNEKIAQLVNCDDYGIYRSSSAEGKHLINEYALNTPDKVSLRQAVMNQIIHQMKDGIGKASIIDLPRRRN